MTDLIPTSKLRIINVDNAVEEIYSFARTLTEQGERPWFEVRYPSPPHLSPAEYIQWQKDQEDTFDAVEVIDGEIVTLPPYAELLAMGGAA